MSIIGLKEVTHVFISRFLNTLFLPPLYPLLKNFLHITIVLEFLYKIYIFAKSSCIFYNNDT